MGERMDEKDLEIGGSGMENKETSESIHHGSGETRSGLLRPTGPRCAPLTPMSSRRSQPTSLLSQTRSFVDGHGGTYLSGEEEHYMTSDDTDDDAEGKGKVFEVNWDGPDDAMNPKNMKTFRKWIVVITLALGSLCVTCTSSIYTTVYDQMDAEFQNSRIVATLGLSLFVFGLGLSPMILGPLSEFYGRRPIYILAYVFFTIWLIPCAVARNIQTMLIARFLDGLSGSAFLSVAGGTVGDMFTRDQLQAPMMIYTASPFIGPGLGPIIGGFINYNVNWRWSFYVLLIWSG
jgi:multidrug resistance protein